MALANYFLCNCVIFFKKKKPAIDGIACLPDFGN